MAVPSPQEECRGVDKIAERKERQMTTVKIKRYDSGSDDVMIERHGYHHTHKNITIASFNRLSRVCKNARTRKNVQNVTHIITTITL